jgi:WD40 repeat protein
VSQVPGEFPFSEEWDGRYVAGAPTADLGVRWNKHGATSRPSPTQYALSQFSIPATTQQHLLSGHRWSLYQACFSPDSSLLASGSSDGTALLWNLKTGRPIANPLTSHRSGVHGVQFSHDGRTLISSGDDSTVRFSHVRTGLEMLVLDSCMFDWPLRRALLEGVDDGMLLVESASGGIPDHTQFAWWPTPSTSEIYNEIDRMRSHDGD